ncbi:extensin [Triticum aestivum]|uniref:extensin n=1 Tax=Triticum aestivum TaxID=4565 RepID=UPI001D00DA82|nr:extensin-like [Triticum aestivum]
MQPPAILPRIPRRRCPTPDPLANGSPVVERPRTLVPRLAPASPSPPRTFPSPVPRPTSPSRTPRRWCPARCRPCQPHEPPPFPANPRCRRSRQPRESPPSQPQVPLPPRRRCLPPPTMPLPAPATTCHRGPRPAPQPHHRLSPHLLCQLWWHSNVQFGAMRDVAELLW